MSKSPTSDSLPPEDNDAEIRVEPPETHTGIKVKDPKSYAAGVEAVTSSFKHVFGLAGLKTWGVRDGEAEPKAWV
ncbi:MAG: hypothetical protein AAGH89_08465 [Verrucomicrobiota bacterium]